jgi:glycosyltransferase involved in cell wall biosynthesis
MSTRGGGLEGGALTRAQSTIPRMRVAVDGRALRPGAARARGVARYLRAVLEQLEALFPEDEYEVVDLGRPRLLTAALTGRPRLDELAAEPDVVWLPAPAPVRVSPDMPYVLTVHDLSFEHRPLDYSAYDRLWHRLARPRRLARRAELVLCVSDATRDAAVRAWHLEPDRARTVLSGPGRTVRARSKGKGTREFPNGYFLAVGALEPRKLPSALIAGHRRARLNGLRAELVFAGDGPLRGKLESSGATLLGHVSDEELDALYSGAIAVACVSRDEGFGFTPLEAAAHGTPSIVADLPVFDETFGGAALRVPVGDPGPLADALLRLEREPEFRNRLAEDAQAAVERLSWERTARETRAALLEAAS